LTHKIKEIVDLYGNVNNAGLLRAFKPLLQRQLACPAPKTRNIAVSTAGQTAIMRDNNKPTNWLIFYLRKKQTSLPTSECQTSIL